MNVLRKVQAIAYQLYISCNIINVIKSRRMRQARHVAHVVRL